MLLLFLVVLAQSVTATLSIPKVPEMAAQYVISQSFELRYGDSIDCGGQTCLTVLIVLGTRPEAIKLAPVIRALHAEKTMFPVVVCTGQATPLLSHGLLTILSCRPTP
jgi:hypothetical protein